MEEAIKTQAKHTAHRYADVIIAIAVSVGVAAMLSIPSGASITEDVAAALGCALIVGAGIMITLRLDASRRRAETFSVREAPTGDFPTSEVPTESELCGTKTNSRLRRGILIGCCLASAILFAAISMPAESAAIFGAPAASLTSLTAFVIVCLATGCSEEGLFRFLLPRAFKKGFIANGRDVRSAARAAMLLSTLLFAFLHVDLGVLPASPLEGASMVLKFVQAALFGLTMAGLVRTPKGLVAAIIVHACYDLLASAPSVWGGGWLSSSYLTGDPLGIAALAAASAALIPAVAAGWDLRKRRENG